MILKSLARVSLSANRLVLQGKTGCKSARGAYVQAVRSAGYYLKDTIMGGRDINDWCAWALEQANRLDPTITSPPSVLDYKDQFYWY